MNTQPAVKGKPITGTWGTFINRRRERGLTQEQAAIEIGVSQTTISVWETKARAPALEDVPRLERFLRMTRAEVLADLSENFLPA